MWLIQGLFRLAAAASVVKKLKSSLDSGKVDHAEFSNDPHAVAGTMPLHADILSLIALSSHRGRFSSQMTETI